MKAPLRALLAVLVFFGTRVLSWVVTLVLSPAKGRPRGWSSIPAGGAR